MAIAATGDPGYDALMSAAGARVVDRDVLLVSGANAHSYLQGQCSQDLDPLTVGATTDALLLSPQGKIDAAIRITRTDDDAFVLDSDPGTGTAARDRLVRFRLRTRVAIEPLAWACLSVRGPAAPGLSVPTGGDGAPQLALPVALPGWTGVDLLGPASEPGAWVPEGAVLVDQGAWEAVRIEAGVPVAGREITPSTIAAEVGLVDRAVSFTKGCFTGQELVARLDARGSNVARKLSVVVVGEGARPPIGAAVWTSDGDHEVGALTSVAWSPGRDATVALATLHRRVVPPTDVEVRWDTPAGSARAGAEARPLPVP